MRLRAANWSLALLASSWAACATTEFVGLSNVPALVAHERRESPLDVEHYALRIALEPGTRSIDANCRIRFHARVDALRAIELDLIGLTVTSVRDAALRNLSFEQSGERLSIQLADPLARGTAAEVDIHYRGTPERGLWFSGERAGVPTQVFTQGECNDSRAWFPCVDEPSERATSELRVVLPVGWKSLAAGELVDTRELSDGTREEFWTMTFPHPVYLTTLVAGELAFEYAKFDSVPLIYASDAEHAPHLARTFGETSQILDFFEALTGARYSFAKYSQACVDNFPFGGMENISATTYTDACIGDERFARDYDATGLIAHEAAHQWFGNLLTCADWSHIWLNESFATYCELLYREETRGVDSFRAAMRDVQEAYLAADVGEFRRPHVWNVYREPMDLFVRGGQAYPGGASRLHFLRFVLGDKAFFRGLRDYVADHRGRAVVTDDFRCSMERSSGVDLAGFFEQWLHKPGYPEFRVRWEWDRTREVARVFVEQVQLPTSNTPNVFTVPVDIEVRDEHGARLERVVVDRREQVFELVAPRRPTWIAFDKYGWIPKRIEFQRDVDEWLALAEFDDDVNGRRDAMHALGVILATPGDETQRNRVAARLLEALDDSSDAVRSAAVVALGRVHVPSDHGIARGLLHTASNDRKSSVRVAALRSLAAWPRDPSLLPNPFGSTSESESWSTLGASRSLEAAMLGRAALASIRSDMVKTSLKDAGVTALCDAIARLQEPERTELLTSIVLSETRHPNARDAAARALAQILRGGSKWTPQFARLLATTRSYRFQSGLIELLIAIGDARAVEALREFHARSRDPRHRRAIEDAWPRLAP